VVSNGGAPQSGETRHSLDINVQDVQTLGQRAATRLHV